MGCQFLHMSHTQNTTSENEKTMPALLKSKNPNNGNWSHWSSINCQNYAGAPSFCDTPGTQTHRNPADIWLIIWARKLCHMWLHKYRVTNRKCFFQTPSNKQSQWTPRYYQTWNCVDKLWPTRWHKGSNILGGCRSECILVKTYFLNHEGRSNKQNIGQHIHRVRIRTCVTKKFTIKTWNLETTYPKKLKGKRPMKTHWSSGALTCAGTFATGAMEKISFEPGNIFTKTSSSVIPGIKML